MLKNYLKIAYRSLSKNYTYSLINILGLSVGIACGLLIIMHIQDEFSYDRHHEQAENIYRMALNRIYPEKVTSYATIPSGIAGAVQDEFPQVKEATRILHTKVFGQTISYEYGEEVFDETKVAFADSNLFRVLTLPLLKGDPETALKQPYSMVMTEATARRYFGDEEAMGKTITTNDTVVFTITGVMENIPHNSHLEMDMIASMTSNQGNGALDDDYIGFSVHTYVRLQPDTPPESINERMPALIEKYAASQIQNRLGVTFKEYQEAGNGYDYFLQPITSIHLHSQLDGEMKPNGNILYVNIFIFIAIFIIILACVNFTNLSTVQSIERAKEVGMRKVLGSNRSQLIQQFLTEAVLVSLISAILAVGLIELMLPFFNNIAGKALVLNYFSNPFLIPGLVLFGVILGLIAGSYPAFVISSFKPVTVLKGKFRHSTQGNWLRNGLVIFQFVISIVLTICTLIVYQQMRFLQNKNLGYNKDHIMVVENLAALGNQIEAFQQEIERYPNIVNSTASNTSVDEGFYFGVMFQPEGTNSEVVTTRGMIIDEDYINTMGIQLVAGRAFSEEYQDSLTIIVNESALAELGLTDKDAIGEKIYSPQDAITNQPNYFTIIGVVKDFHFQSLHQDIGSLIMFNNKGPLAFNNNLSVRLTPDNIHESIALVEENWRKFNSQEPFRYHFLDERLWAQYQNEEVSGKVFAAFTGLALLIACIGLLGLIAYITQGRRKEIGIRKVLGASQSSIFTLLTKDFLILILIANIIAIPIAYLAMNNWLQDFAYRVSMHPFVFLIAGILALIIVLATISFHTLKATRVNPVEVLKNE